MKSLLFVIMFSIPVFASGSNCAPAEGSATNAVVRCEARTKSGAQCKRRAQKGKTLCRQHEKLVEKKR